MAGTSKVVRVEGLRELVKATGGYKTALAKEIRAELIVGAKLVSTDARSRMTRIDAKSAMGLVPFAKATGVSGVKQRKKKRLNPGRGDYGALQMRKALLPALWSKRDDIERNIERMLDKLGGRWSAGA